MKITDAFNKTNGKKRYIIGGGLGVIGLPFLLTYMLNLNTVVTATESQTKTNTKQIDFLKDTPAQIARIDATVADIKEDFTDFRKIQRKHNDKMDGKLERILEAVK